MAIQIGFEAIGDPYAWKGSGFSWKSGTAKRPWTALCPVRFHTDWSEDVSLAEERKRTAVFERALTETLQIRSASGKRTEKEWTERLALQEVANRMARYSRVLTELANIRARVSKQPRKTFADAFAADSAAQKKSKKRAAEKVACSDSVEKNYAKAITELMELADAITKRTQKEYQDQFDVGSAAGKKLAKIAIEEIAALETLLKETVYRRNYEEQIQAATHGEKRPRKNFQEGLQALETYLRNANAVLSNLYYSNKALTLEEFQQMDAPVGFQTFRDFVIGDYTYQEAMLRMVVEGAVMAARPLALDWELNVDVPDVNDRGTCTVEAAGSRIDFTKRFYAPPEVTIAVRGGLSAIPDYEIDDTGFSVILRQADGTGIQGVISWSANGY